MSGVLVIGGCSRLAKNKLSELLDEGHTVVVYDSLIKSGFAAKELLPSGVEFVFGDVRDEIMLTRVIKDKEIKIIYNFVELPKDQSIDDFEVNVGAVLKIKKLSEKYGLEFKSNN